MHREAARKLLGLCPEQSASQLATATIYLGGYIAECVLKGLLVSRHPTKDHSRMIEEELKGRIGHNLELLKRELATRGVNWPSRQTEQLRRIRTVWSSGLRYDSVRHRYEDAKRVVEAADGLFRWAAGE